MGVTILAHPSFSNPEIPAKNVSIQNTILILEACLIPKTRAEIFALLNITNQSKNFTKHIAPMISLGLLQLTIPDKPNSNRQQYITTVEGKKMLETATHR